MLDFRQPEKLPDGKFLYHYRGYSFIVEHDAPSESLINVHREIDYKIRWRIK